MKSFFEFLSEATASKAVQQATRMGLTSDGHGGWYDKTESLLPRLKAASYIF